MTLLCDYSHRRQDTRGYQETGPRMRGSKTRKGPVWTEGRKCPCPVPKQDAARPFSSRSATQDHNCKRGQGWAGLWTSMSRFSLNGSSYFDINSQTCPRQSSSRAFCISLYDSGLDQHLSEGWHYDSQWVSLQISRTNGALCYMGQGRCPHDTCSNTTRSRASGGGCVCNIPLASPLP